MATDNVLRDIKVTSMRSLPLDSAMPQPPTVDAVEVVHGRWIEKPYLLGTTRYCSVCGQNYGMPHGVFNYCPNCGAKMDGGVGNGC